LNDQVKLKSLLLPNATFQGIEQLRLVLTSALRLEVQLTAGHVQVNERRIRDGDALAGFDSGDVEGGVTVSDPDNLTHQVNWSPSWPASLPSW